MLLFTNIALQKSYLSKNNKIGTNYLFAPTLLLII